MEIVLWIGGVLLFVLILIISVGLHEAGHLAVAKRLGLNVPDFAVGFGKKIFKFQKGGTEYSLRWIPLGGFVRILDPSEKEMDDEDRALLSYVAPWKRILVFAAGPFVNIVLGFVILVSFLLINPAEVPNTTIEMVNHCEEGNVMCGAGQAGIQAGDTIIAVNGNEIVEHSQISQALDGVSTATITVERNGVLQTFENVAITDSMMGVRVGWDYQYRTLGGAIGDVGDMIVGTAEAVIGIPAQVPELMGAIVGVNERDPESAGSVVGVGRAYGDVAATDKIETNAKVSFMVLAAGGINLSLGIINFFPLLPLDGGRILIASIDSARIRLSKVLKKVYKPTSTSVIRIATAIPAAALFFVMAVLIVADVFAPVQFL